MRHPQKVEPPPGAITPWDAHPDFSETGNQSSPHCPAAFYLCTCFWVETAGIPQKTKYGSCG